MRARLSPPVFAAAATLAVAAPAGAGCTIGKVAELPVTMAGALRPLIPAKVNGMEALFLLDTGAFYSTLTTPGAARLKVRTRLSKSVGAAGVGGDARAHVGVADTFGIGGVEARNVEFVVVAASDLKLRQDGVVGMNALQSSDMELDLAHGVVRFFRTVDCEHAELDYWDPGKANVLTLEQGWTAHPPLIAQAQVDGHTVTVQFDTGASVSVLSRTAAAAAGVPLDGADTRPAGRVNGIGHLTVDTVTAPVASFTLGRETIQKTRLRVANMDLGTVDMLLGADFFLSHRVYVAQGQHRLYFTYNGGPVFQLGVQAAEAAPAPAPTPAQDGAPPR